MLNLNRAFRTATPGLFIAIIILITASDILASRLPDTLKFNRASYIKRIEKLYHNRARLILINENQRPAYVMAELFEKHVSFLNPAGKVVKTDSFPQTPGFAYSKTGKWLYLWGRKNYADNYYRLYGPEGKVIFEKIMPSSGSEPSTGKPLEDPGTFIKMISPDGILALVDTVGNILYSADPLADSAQADILFDADLKDNAIFVAASPGSYTEFISYNNQLIEQKRTILPFVNAVQIRAADDGRFALINFYDTEKGWPMVVMSATGQNLYQAPTAKTSRLSRNSQYLGAAKGNKEVMLLNTDSWETIVKVDSAAMAAWPYSGKWKSVEFSDDNQYMLALSEGVLLCIDIQYQTWKALDFPYSFWQARLLNGSTDLYLTGSYGWVLYEILK